MTERCYCVILDNAVVATNMSLSTALILVKGLFEEYYNEHSLAIAIKEIDKRLEEGCSLDN